jgi:hypothetical protein
LALVPLALAVFSAVVFASVPKTAPDPLRDAATIFFMAAFALGPVCHAVGFVLGIVAIFRPHDRRVLGLLGAGLNLLVLAGVGLFLWLFFTAVGAFR